MCPMHARLRNSLPLLLAWFLSTPTVACGKAEVALRQNDIRPSAGRSIRKLGNRRGGLDLRQDCR